MKHNTCITIIMFSLSLTGSPTFSQAKTIQHTLINTNPDPSGEPWLAGGISFEEWISSLPKHQSAPAKKSLASVQTSLPSKVDNSINPAFRPVINQNGGSCAQASAIGYQYTYEINVLRNLPSNVPENQYPYDFTYNFLNAGNSSNGSLPVDGWEIIYAVGIPDCKTYGGFNSENSTMWMSGYDKYYKSMSNRLESVFPISIRNAADIEKMKQFLYDHSNGSSTGGLLNFESYMTGVKIVGLATGTPDEGKKAIVSFGTSGGHAMVIVGYDDSVRYDFNGDGLYTNDVDINNDGAVDVRDWEIGAAVMVNSWGTSWGDGGKAYLMYKLLADDMSAGGIWGNAVGGITITNKNVKPLLTFKIKMTYDPRSKIIIKAGYNINAGESTPSATKTFGKAFNLSGGEFPMKGFNNTDPIEIGLDVSDFLPNITTSQYALFLQVESSGGSGVVQQFSVIDYSSDKIIETVCRNKNVTVAAGTTTLKIVKAPLMVVSPNGGEQWDKNRSFDIVWTCKDTSPVTIELFKGGELHSVINSSAPGTGTYTWKIPASIISDTDYAIRIRNITDTSLSGVSEKSFSIQDSSQLELLTPNTPDYLTKGNSVTIQWKSNVSGLLRIDLYRHGAYQMSIAEVPVSNNSYIWKIPDSLQNELDYRVRITSTDRDWLFDESNKDFGIGSPVVSVPYEQTFDSFALGESISTGWEQAKDDDINWSVNKGATPSRLNPQAGGTGPNGDHTSGSGNYIYVEASTPNNPDKSACLLSPVFNIKEMAGVRASFWLHMYSSEKRMGKIWIDINADGHWNDSVLYFSGDHQDKWFGQSVDLSDFNASLVQFRFRALTGTDYDSDICLDDFSITLPVPIVNSPRKDRLQSRILTGNNGIKIFGYSGRARIFTISGKQILNQSILKNEEKIDISRLPKGVYVLKLKNKTLSFSHN